MPTIPELPAAATPLSGDELTIINQNGADVNVPVSAMPFATAAQLQAETMARQAQVLAFFGGTATAGFLQNAQTITVPLNIPEGFNAALVGPIALGAGGSIAIQPGGRLKLI